MDSHVPAAACRMLRRGLQHAHFSRKQAAGTGKTGSLKPSHPISRAMSTGLSILGWSVRMWWWFLASSWGQTTLYLEYGRDDL